MMNYRSYDEIFSEILSEYDEKPSMDSEQFKRLEIMAHQVYTLERLIAELEKECFAATASGEYLDRIAAEYGLERKARRKSHGTLELSVSNALDFDVNIPKGSIFAAENGTEFATSESCLLESGAVAVSVAAESLLGAESANVPALTVGRIVSAPSKIEFVRNTADFSGGADEESDFAFRKRLLERMSESATGANEEYYRQIALNSDSVGKVNVCSGGNGTVNIYVWGNNSKLSDEEIERLKGEYLKKAPIGTDVNISNATAHETDLSVYIASKDGYSFEEARSDVTEKLNAFFESAEIGEGLTRAQLFSVLMACESVKNMSLPSSFEDIEVGENEILTGGTLNIREMS